MIVPYPFSLSILDQSPRHQKETDAQAIQHTIRLATLADQWGYHRFWVAEHHGDKTLVSATPEILLTHLCQLTKRIRIGTGGILLPHYSPLKIAEVVNTIRILFPQRTDIGIGRSLGCDPAFARFLGTSDAMNQQVFEQKLETLIALLNGAGEFTPRTHSEDSLWLLSSSGASAILAAKHGLALSFAHFINPSEGPSIVEAYRTEIQKQYTNQSIALSIAVLAVCAETVEKSIELATIMAFLLMQNEYGQPNGVPDYASIMEMEMEDHLRRRIAFHLKRIVHGTPTDVMNQLQTIANDYQSNEIMIITITDDAQSRERSYELLSQFL